MGGKAAALLEIKMKKKHEQNIEQYPVHIETKVALLEQSLSYMQNSLEVIVKNVDKANDKIDKVDHKVDSRFLWLLSFIIAGFSGLGAIMAHGFHWF
jgi:hypothetical protein